MEHTLDFHINSLKKLCRACGERSMNSRKANQRPHLCVNFKMTSCDIIALTSIQTLTINIVLHCAVNASTGFTTSEKLLTIKLYLSPFKCLRTVHTCGQLTMII